MLAIAQTRLKMHNILLDYSVQICLALSFVAFYHFNRFIHALRAGALVSKMVASILNTARHIIRFFNLLSQIAIIHESFTFSRGPYLTTFSSPFKKTKYTLASLAIFISKKPESSTRLLQKLFQIAQGQEPFSINFQGTDSFL